MTRGPQKLSMTVGPPKLSIGCGEMLLGDDWIHLDHTPHLDPDVLHDLNGPEPMPFPDNHFNYVYADNVIEHLRPGGDGFYFAIADVWRVLKPGGLFEIDSPTIPYPNAFGTFHQTFFSVDQLNRHIYATLKDAQGRTLPEWYGHFFRFAKVSERGCENLGYLDITDSLGTTMRGWRRYVWVIRAVK